MTSTTTGDGVGGSPCVPLVRCPTSPTSLDGSRHTIIGCGALVTDERDHEGLVDCPQCGIWFDPSGEDC